MNMGQMVNDIKVAIDCKVPVTHYGRTGGVIPTVEELTAEIARAQAAFPGAAVC